MLGFLCIRNVSMLCSKFYADLLVHVMLTRSSYLLTHPSSTNNYVFFSLALLTTQFAETVMHGDETDYNGATSEHLTVTKRKPGYWTECHEIGTEIETETDTYETGTIRDTTGKNSSRNQHVWPGTTFPRNCISYELQQLTRIGKNNCRSKNATEHDN